MTRSSSGGWWGLRSSEIGLVFAILAVVVATAIVDSGHNYWNDPAGSIKDVARQSAQLGIVALGAAVVIICGGIDLSAGSMIAFSGTVCAAILVLLAPEAMNSGSGEVLPLTAGVIFAAIAGTLLVGLLVGALHAWLITAVGLPPFIATLATLVGLRSLARAICEAVTEAVFGARSTQIAILDERFRYMNFWRSDAVADQDYSVSTMVAVFGVLAALVWLLLARTVVGRHIYAVGGNEQAARLSGIRTDRVKWLAYSISALVSAIAGIFAITQQSVADPQVQGINAELNAIAGAVVGGCSLQGGVGTLPGVVLGVLFLRCVLDGIAKVIKTGADVYEGLIVGIVVVLAVAISQVRKGGGGAKQFFTGALGWAAILALAALAGTLAAVVSDKRYAAAASVVAALLLVAVKIVQDRAARRPGAG